MTRWKKFSPRKKKTYIKFWIGRVFFTALLVAYVCFVGHYAKLGYNMLMDWLVRLEASQPDVRSEEVFTELFADPDWAQLYEMAGEEDTLYEGKEAYATYMENKVGNQKLSYVETSAGLSGNKKYIVKLDDEKIAEFTLKDEAPEGEEIPDWTLDEVFVYYTRQETLTIFTVPGHTVYINGVQLDTEEHKIATTYTVVEEYLEEGLHGYRDMTLSFGTLLLQPEVTILDENGEPVEVEYDPAVNLYAEKLAAPAPISQEQEDMIIGAAQAFGKYMINAKDHKLSSFFDKNSKAYQDIIQYERWTMQDYKSYAFDEMAVSSFYQYSDSYYSARVSMTLNVTRKNGTVKPYHLDTTFFVRLQENGSYLVETMTNVDVQEVRKAVKLEYRNGSTVLHTEWVPTDAEKIQLPPVEIPAGKTFLGWYTKTVNGLDVSYTAVFSPTEVGYVILPEDYVLQPMVLYALFR